jgi:hypothetical protein
MKNVPLFRSWLIALGTGLLVLVGHELAYSQAISEDQVKAAYLYNFAKFVEWPQETFPDATTPIHLCVLNDARIGSGVNLIVKDKHISGRSIVVVPIQTAEQGRSCQILFINSAQNGQVEHILKVLQGASVLTVGETTGFVEQGGIVNFVIQDDQVHFQVNHKAATQSRLRMSARLLSVAKLVIE